MVTISDPLRSAVAVPALDLAKVKGVVAEACNPAWNPSEYGRIEAIFSNRTIQSLRWFSANQLSKVSTRCLKRSSYRSAGTPSRSRRIALYINESFLR